MKKQKCLECVFCRGKMKKGTTPFHIDRKGIHFIFAVVPAMVCGQCGQAMFEEPEARVIDELVGAVDEKTKNLWIRK